jgi:hypothetical protein
MTNFYHKYLKYKIKYHNLKKQLGASNFISMTNIELNNNDLSDQYIELYPNKRLLPLIELDNNEIDNDSRDIKYGIWNKLPNELYIIGDIHGDFFSLKQALELTNCVLFPEYTDKIYKINEFLYDIRDGCDFYSLNENKIKWNPEKVNCYIVFAGDLIDRCRIGPNNRDCSNTVNDENCDYKILKLLLDLNNDAQQYDSRVIIIIGNHEIMNLQNDYRYVSNKGTEDGQRNNQIKNLIETNIDNLYAIVRINRYIIVHGGINDKYFDEINKFIIPKKDMSYETIGIYNKIFRSSIKNINILYLGNKMYKSPFWDRTLGGYELLNPTQCKKIFEDNILNIKPFENNHYKIIVAHCPQFTINESINLKDCQEFNNRIYRIDVAMSRAFDEYQDVDLYKILYSITDIFNIDYNIFYKPTINRNVCILKITKMVEEKINGISSIDYFYNNIFKTNKERLQYLLSDLYKIINNKYQFATNDSKYLKLLLDKIKNFLYTLSK